MAGFLTLLRKAPPPIRQNAGPEVMPFFILGPLMGHSIVQSWSLPSNSEGEKSV